jgi:agmatine/peptidylarginine deiminase
VQCRKLRPAPQGQNCPVGYGHNGDADLVPVMYAPVRSRRQIPDARGVYTNLLALHPLVVVPTYRIPADDLACRQISAAYPDCDVVPLDCRTIAREGGAVHCVSADSRDCRSRG